MSMDRIYVVVRARPLLPEDATSSPWRISGNTIRYSNQSTNFSFDRVFGEECKTVDVYEERTKAIVESAVRGFNGTVFAYGQTSSGKTYTMRGTRGEPGVIPLAVRDLFQTIKEDIGREFLVRMSYMEIYNEEINDLLVPEHRKLQIHESPERGIFVAGLREEIVTTPDQVLDLVEFGESHRHIGETNMNLYSSRSHTIFRMIIESRERSEDNDGNDSCDAVRVSILNLVDLAGSERAAKTGAEGLRLKEGSHINKSLMTLGTVIKKLSESVEGQGGHVPYRDSKLTRILQPALGGNANTAIICNITLAQVHADETKSSLQFSNRALHVTNHACVNEILTDAALLKRQKKEIEELRAKLQGSHSEHWEMEIVNLRNTLLQSELEKERIALELEEEKKAKELRDRRLKEQAQKIANLSSMVIHSKQEENTFANQKKRRQTWCPASLPQIIVSTNSGQDCASTIAKQSRAHFNDYLPTFDKLLQETEAVTDETPCDTCTPNVLENTEKDGFHLPNACALLHVTDRRKVHLKNSRLLKRIGEDVNSKNVPEDELIDRFNVGQLDKSSCDCCKNLTTRESEAILVIKQLQDQVTLSEMEKTMVQKNMDSVMALASEQSAAFEEKYNELRNELLIACGDAKVTQIEVDSLKSPESSEEAKLILFPELAIEIEGIALEFHKSRDAVDDISAMVEDLFHSFSMLSKISQELKLLALEDMQHLLAINCSHKKENASMTLRIEQLNSEKLLLNNQCTNYNKEIRELESELQHMEESMKNQNSQHNLEKEELCNHIIGLQKEVACLSSSSLIKESDTLRKDLEKTRSKLKETESKLRNSLQDKSKLESEKAQIEREVKQLRGQNALLERDICKRDVIAFDFSRTKAHVGMVQQKTQMDQTKLGYDFFDMETEISSLKEDLLAATEEKQNAINRCQIANLEVEDMADKLNSANSDLKLLKEKMDTMALRLSESESCCERFKSSIDLISKEKEQMMEELTNSLLELEMERSTRSRLEKTLLDTSDRVKVSDNKIRLLSNDLSEVRHEVESFREQCKTLREKLAISTEHEKQMSLVMSEVSQLKADIEQREIDADRHDEYLKGQLLSITKERNDVLAKHEELKTIVSEVEIINKSYEEKMKKAKSELEEQARRIDSMETKIHNDAVVCNKDKTKLRMKLHGTQAKLDAYRGRYEDAVGEMRLMKKKYEEATRKYQERLASYGIEILRLKGKSIDVTVDELLQTPSECQ